MKLETWIVRHLGGDLSVAALAKKARMSARSFARSYRAQKGATPAKAVQRLRVSTAGRLLIDFPARSLAQVAHDCGFGSERTMRRAFRLVWGFTPVVWRDAIKEATVTPEEEAKLADILDTMDKRLLCLGVNIDRQFGNVLYAIREQLDRIEVLAGGTLPRQHLIDPPVEPTHAED